MTDISERVRANPLATRADAQRLLRDLTAPLESGFSPGRAQIRLGLDSAHFNRKAQWFEGYARPLWGLAPLHAGGGGFDFWDRFREGLASGTDPNHPEYWEAVTDLDQRSVEMAALGFALALAPDQLWDPLPEAAKRRAAAWLGGVQSVEMADNNWHFFPVMAGLGLQRVGEAIDTASRDRHLARIDEFIGAEGWYGDGAGGWIDHYNGFALHFYGLIYAAHRAERDPARAQAYKDRAAAFAQGFRHWFGADGAALAIGRSLTYRFAMAGFWGALAYAGVEALPWGQIRGLWARQIRWWMRQPIFDAAGRLPVGYRWPNYFMSEEYNSPGSPYWAFKAFLPLALPNSHPFWTAREEALDAPDGTTTLRGASMLVRRSQGDVVALPAGPVRTEMRGSTDKYGKLAYSSRWGLAVEADRWLQLGFCGDNILAVSRDGQEFRARGALTASRVGDGWIETVWQPIAGVRVTTLQAFAGDWEARLHRIASDAPLAVIETGHAVPAHSRTRGKLKQAFETREAGPQGLTLAVADGHASSLADLGGLRRAVEADVAPNTHLVFPQASVPALVGRIGAGETLLVSLVRPSWGLDPEALPASLPSADDLRSIAEAAGWNAAILDWVTVPRSLEIRRRPVAEWE
ncbi:DUF2264 domain-containing protein [Inquilinus limosus]|uniref:DUF2264 domain-containing protein n=1 Tax=Inquilinus limosus TaxID=171674 RepID=UPI00040AAE55|nr:DUF2264 domain-containing protein [Inquilinus limosus]